MDVAFEGACLRSEGSGGGCTVSGRLWVSTPRPWGSGVGLRHTRPGSDPVCGGCGGAFLGFFFEILMSFDRVKNSSQRMGKGGGGEDFGGVVIGFLGYFRAVVDFLRWYNSAYSRYFILTSWLRCVKSGWQLLSF